MAEAGCVGLYFGIETGSTRMQQISKKRLKLELVEPTLSVCEQLGIETTASFITGYHEETEADLADTLDLLGRCFGPSCLTQLHMLAPEPGTPMFDQLSDKLAYDGYAGPYNAFLVGANDERLVLDHPDIFSTYHYYPAELPRAYYKFAVEATDALRRLGSVIMNYLLRAYEGQLSKLIFALRDWAHCNQRMELPTALMLEEFVSERFGPQHHLSSLVRFALCNHKEAPHQDLPANAQSVSFDPEQSYQLGPHVHVLSDLHDCQFLLDRIKQNSNGPCLLDESETGGRGTYLVSITTETTINYRIDPGLEALLDFFVEPRSCTEVTDLIREMTGVGQLDGNYFAPLVNAGILVPQDHKTHKNV
jgi:hypothetical protein